MVMEPGGANVAKFGFNVQYPSATFHTAHYSANTNLFNAADQEGMRFQNLNNTVNNWSELLITNAGGGNSASIAAQHLSHVSQSGNLIFATGQSGSLTEVFRITSTNRMAIGNTAALYKLDVGASYRFGVAPDYGGNGDIGANSVLIGSHAADFAFFPSIDAGTVGKKIQFAYFNGTAVKSAVEIANVASGLGNLLLMKGGGTVTVGATAKIAATNALEAVGGDMLVQDTEAALFINSTDTSMGSYVLMQSNGTNIFSFQVGGTTGPTGIAKQILVKNLISGGGFDFLVNAVSTPVMRIGDNGNTTIGSQADWTTNGTEVLSVVGGNIAIQTAGKGLKIKEGSNAKMGIVTLVGGTATVATTAALTNSRIFLTVQGGTLTNVGDVYVSARVNATSFTITSLNILDTSDVAWIIFDQA